MGEPLNLGIANTTFSLFRSLRHRSFALLWGGQTISRLGNALYQVGLAWWVLEKTGSAATMGAVLVLTFAPNVVFALLGGVAVDRLRRAQVMLASDLLRGSVVAVVAVLAASRLLEVGHVYAVSLLFGFVGAFFGPAYTALTPEVVPRDSLPSANSLTSLGAQFAGIAGPAVGAAIVAQSGTAAAFGLDAVSFFVSAGCLAPLLAVTDPPVREPRRGGILRDVREGLGAVLAVPWLWITIAFAGLVNISYSGPWSVVLPFLVRDHLQGGVGWLGLVYSMLSLGFVLGAVWLGRGVRVRHRGLIAYGGWMVGGLMTFLLGLPIPLGTVLAIVLIAGVADAAFAMTWTNTLQEMVPGQLLGRVSSIDFLGSFILMPAGYGLAGWASDAVGPSLVFIIGGLATLGLAGLVLLHPAIRQLD